MARPPLPLGTFGSISCTQATPGRFRARCLYRDWDGRVHEVERQGPSKNKAEARLKEALRDWISPVADATITADSKVKAVAEAWLVDFEVQAVAGEKSLNSLDTYRSWWLRHVAPAVGDLLLRELNATLLNRLCQTVKDTHSAATAKGVRVVLSAICGYAIQEGALKTNPAREVRRIETSKGERQRKADVGKRALTPAQILDLFRRLDGDDKAVRADLPDLVRLFLATGERTGEALGAHWPWFNADAGELWMGGNVIHPRGRGQMLNAGKTATAQRPIPLPSWCVTMLAERRWEADDLDGPIFPSRAGTMRSPANVRRSWRDFLARQATAAHDPADYTWVTFRTLRKTVITLLDEAGLTARQIADVVGHSHVSMTQDVYMARKITSRKAARALESVVQNSPVDGVDTVA